MLEAHGEFLFMCDADLSMPVEEILRFLPPALEDYDVAIGSRSPGRKALCGTVLPSSRRPGHQPHDPHLSPAGIARYSMWVKRFRKEVAGDLFRSLTKTGWSFDVEVLYIARLRGYKIVELPVPWYYNPQSKLSLFKDTLRMALDILEIRQNAQNGVYLPEKPGPASAGDIRVE